MGTIAEKLRHLAETKTAIKNAITAKGVSVAESDTFRAYATKIGQIRSGSGILEIPIASSPSEIYFIVDFKSDTSLQFNVQSGRFSWHCMVCEDGNLWKEIGIYSGSESPVIALGLSPYPTGQLLFRILAESANVMADVNVTAGQCNITIPVHQNNVIINRLYN